MRRRVSGERVLTAEELVDRSRQIEASLAGSVEVRRHAWRVGLGSLGYTPLDVFRARYWIRRGKPPGYAWNEPDKPTSRFEEAAADPEAKMPQGPEENGMWDADQ